MNSLAKIVTKPIFLRSCSVPVVFKPTVFRRLSDDLSEKEKKDKAKEAEDKLSSLLSSLKTSRSVKPEQESKVKLAQPKGAKVLKRTKSGLPKPTVEDANNKLEPEIIESVKSVSSLLADEKKRKRTESQLLGKLRNIQAEADSSKDEDNVAGEDMTMVFKDIKVERKVKKEISQEQRAFLEKRRELRRQDRTKSQGENVVVGDIFSGTPLGIFDGPMPDNDYGTTLKFWEECREREMKILGTPSPRNAIEEMILWTNQGKLWKFPIDNEQGLDYQEDPFHKHVFLEHYLEPWCPKTGPVRHFMELVVVGLSKNPYLSSSKKLDTIQWFKEYFEREDNLEILIHGGFWEEKPQVSA